MRVVVAMRRGPRTGGVGGSAVVGGHRGRGGECCRLGVGGGGGGGCGAFTTAQDVEVLVFEKDEFPGAVVACSNSNQEKYTEKSIFLNVRQGCCTMKMTKEKLFRPEKLCCSLVRLLVFCR